MKGLLYKDLYLIRNKIWIGMGIIFGVFLFAVIIVLGMTKGNFKSIAEEADIFQLFFKGLIFFVLGTGIYTALNSASAIDMDEKSEWFKVLYASPITVIQEVASRYLLAFIVNTGMAIWSAVILPFVYLAGDKSYGIEEMKLVGYGWLLGMLLIFLRLPIDILFSAKTSTMIMVGFLSVCMAALMVWIAIAGNETVFRSIGVAIRFVCQHGGIFAVGTIVVSFLTSYFGKQKRRWI